MEYTYSNPGPSPYPTYGGLGARCRQLLGWDGDGPDAPEWTVRVEILDTHSDGTVTVGWVEHDITRERIQRDALRSL